ncbi:phage tail protein [Streptococcus equinus]|uniref:phage tail protein n=1 Tax=Streptococcus equinus TaxID=1335 RepID=UPI00051B52D0|nr:phage tail protein [Streptococcus equinus]QBX15680.1 endopeptidase [Streptococcus phage Javan199]
MITFLDEKDVEHGALATIKVTNAVNGERSLTGEIESGDYVLSNIERGWRLRFDDEFYVVTYAKPIDDGKTTHVTFDAVHQFFWDFDKSSVHEQLNDGSHTFLTYLDFIFTGSDYTYTIDPLLKVYAFEKQSFGYKSRLKLFNDVITSSGVEFQVNGKVVRILEKTGTDLSTVVRKNFNMNELGIEKNIGDFVTYQKGFGAWVDENDHTKGRLVTEYTSPLASVYGKLEAEPLVDERYTQADNMVAALKDNVDNSYSISVRLDMEDLTRAGYDYTQPRAGDYIMAINETLDFQEKIRIVSFTSEYDVTGQLIKHEVTCNDIGAVKKLSASYSLTKEQAQSASATVVKAVEMANKALISADGKSTVYFGTEFPEDEPKGELHKGDSLYLTVGDTTKMYYWTGADWEELPIVNDVKAFQDQINDELKDIPDREEVESTINQKIATSKAEIKTQIDTAKSQAESNAKSYADEINQATAEVADQANTAADALKTDLAKVKTDLTATTSTANSAKTSANEAKQQITTVANNLSKTKTDLTDSIAAVDNKADTIQSNVSKAQSDIQTVASNLTKAKQDLQTSISSVDSKADGIQSNLTKAKTDLQSSISSVDSKTDTVQANLTKAKIDLQASIATVDGKTDTVQTNLTKAKNDLQTQINAVPGQITSAVSAVEGKIAGSLVGQNLYIKSTSVKGFLPATGGAGLGGQNAVNKEVTSDFIRVNENDKYVFQGWLTVPDGNYSWRAWQYYDADKQPINNRQTPGFNVTTDEDNVSHFQHIITMPTNVKYIRISARLYSDGKLKFEKGSVATDYSLAPEDTASQIDSLSSQIQQTADGMTLLATRTELNNAKSELNTSIAAVNTKATNLQTDVSNLNASLSNTSKTVQAHATTLANQTEELQNQANQLTAQAEAQDALTTRVATVETTANGTKSTVSELSKTVASNTNNITSVTNRTKTVETDLTNAKTSISELQTNLSSTQTGLTNLTKRTKDVEDDLSGTKTTLTELSQTVADDGESITELTTKTATIESSVNGLKTSLTNTQKDLTSVTTRTKNIEDDLAGTKTSLTSLSATVAADGQTITSLSNKTKTIESNVDGLTTSLSNTQKDLTSVTNRTKTVEDTLDGTRTELAELQETVDTTNSDLASVTQRTSTVESDLSGTKTSLSNLTKTVSDDGKTIASLSSQTKTIESTVNGLSTSLTSTQQDLAGITTRTKNVEDDLSGTKTELAELQTTVDTTNTDLANVTKRTKTVEDSLAGTKTSLSSLSQTVANNGQDITSLSSRTKTVEDSVSGLTTTMTSVQQTLTSTTSRTKAVEDNLNGTKTTLAQVQSTANANSQKTATLENNLDGLNAKFSSLKVGGRNLLAKTNQGKTNWVWSVSKGSWSAETVDVDGISAVKLTRTSAETSSWSVIEYQGLIRNLIEADTDYTLSFDVYPSVNATFIATLVKGNSQASLTNSKTMNTAPAEQWTKVSTTLHSLQTLPEESGQLVYLRGMPCQLDNYLIIKNIKLEKGNIATDYSPNEADIELKVADYKQTADQNYASLQSTVQALDGTVTANKATADQTAQGFSTRIESLETYKDGESTRANQYFESSKTETARQLAAERTAIANDYVAKSTYTEDVSGIRNDLTATTTTANTTKTNLASYQASNDQAVASLQSSLQTTDGNVSSLQTQINALPGQITSAVSAVEGKIPKDIERRNLYIISNSTAGYIVYGNASALGNQNTTYKEYTSDYIPVSVGEKYTFQGWVTLTESQQGWRAWQFYNEDKSLNGGRWAANYTSDYQCFQHTLTVPEGAKWLRVSARLYNDGKIMVEKNDVYHDYTIASEDTANQISSLSSQIQQTANGMTLLATKTELNTAKSDLQSGITTATSKADSAQATADNNAQTISNHTTQISALNTGLQAKVSQSDFNTLSGRVSSAESNLTATASQLSSQISSVENKIPDSIAGSNLYIKSTSVKGFLPATGGAGLGGQNAVNKEVTSDFIRVNENDKYVFQGWLTVPDGNYSWRAWQYYDADKQPINNRQTPGFNVTTDEDNVSHFQHIITMPTNVKYIRISARLYSDGKLKFEKGSVATDYNLAPEDLVSAGDLATAKSEIKQTTDAITASVSSVQTAASNAQSTANAAQAGVNTLDSTTVKSASLTIGTDGVVMKAGKSTSDIANAIGSYFSVNQNAINLFSDKISVKGSMIVDGAITSTKIASKSINTAHLNGKIITADVIATGAITADAIKAGAITTDKMTANSINGDRITAGTLDAAKIKAGSITASQIASGTITSNQIATGTISAGNIATGAITTDKIAANSINSDKIVSSGITANVIKGGKLQSLTNTTNFDLDTGKLFYNNNNTGVFRVEDGASTMGLKFSNTAITVNNTSRILSRVILGGDRRETTLDDGKWDQGGFTGIVAETINGVDSDQHAQADTLRVIGDNIYFTHSYNYDSLTSTSAQGWKMETFSPFSSYAGNVVLKPYGINYRQSDIITGDIRLDNGDGSGYWVRGCIRILRNCFQHYLNGGTSSGAMNAIRDALREISGV